MAINPKTIVTDYAKFCEESAVWCAQSSESDVTVINEIVMSMANDLRRRSSVSGDALKVLANAKDEITSFLSKRNLPLVDVVKTLRTLSTESAEIGDLLNPIIEALQFQDRLRQNLENIAKIIKVWAAARSQNPTPEELGTRFLKSTTSSEERDLIRAVFHTLPMEDTTVDTAILF